MRNKLTAREKINAKSGISIKNLDFENGTASFDCIAVTISATTDVEGNIFDTATFITADGTAVNTISATIIESVNDIMALIDSGEITADEVLTITVIEKTSNAGRKFYMIEI